MLLLFLRLGLTPVPGGASEGSQDGVFPGCSNSAGARLVEGAGREPGIPYAHQDIRSV